MMSLPGRADAGKERETAALLGAFCLFLSTIEYLIPKPLPFIRLGIANLPLMLGIDIFPLKAFLLLGAVKIFGQAMITGTLFSYIFVFSLAGTLFSALSMYAARRLSGGRLGFAGTGVLGAAVFNIVQLVLGRFMIFGQGVWYIAPPVLGLGIISGTALGLFCEYFSRKSLWYREAASARGAAPESVSGGYLPQKESLLRDAPPPENFPPPGRVERSRLLRAEYGGRLFSGRALFIAGLCIVPGFLFNPDTAGRSVQFLLFVMYAWFTGKRIRPLHTVTVMLGIAAVNLLVPYGRVLCSLGPFDITSGALRGGLHRAVTLEALVMISRAAIRPDLKLPGAFGELMGGAFRIFGGLEERRHLVNPRDIAGSIDALLAELGAGPAGGAAGPVFAERTGLRGRIILLAAVVLSWVPFFVYLRFL